MGIVFLSLIKGARLAVLAVILLSCNKVNESYICCDKEVDGFAIAYGTSFGECIGYCMNSILVTNEKVSYQSQSWSDSLDTKVSNGPIEKELWDSLMLYLDVEEFTLLPGTIGCPDCADGGAEWVEVLSDNVHHKVTFEYGKTPEEIERVTSLLRNVLFNLNKETKE